MLSFFADENIASQLVEWIRSKGHVISSVKEENLQGMLDVAILEKAFNQKRIILTQDSDFGRLIYTSTLSFYIIIYMRPGHFDGKFHIPTIERVLAHPDIFKPSTLIIAHRNDDKINIRIKHL